MPMDGKAKAPTSWSLDARPAQSAVAMRPAGSRGMNMTAIWLAHAEPST